MYPRGKVPAIQIILLKLILPAVWYSSHKTMIRKLIVEYNNCLRRLLGIPLSNSASGMFFNLNIQYFGDIHHNYINGFIVRVNNYNDTFVQSGKNVIYSPILN